MIDLRSDICAPPTGEMWEAMRAAPLGWATYGEDPSVNRLEAVAAAMLGKQAAVWVPTCGMANLAALLVLAEGGSTVVLERSAHILTSEAMGLAHVARLSPHALDAPGGHLDPDAVEAAIAEAGASVLCLENTHTRAGGVVLSPAETGRLAAAARAHGARVHLDGARLPNAAVSLGVPMRELARGADTVAVSLNKGLCAPLGAVLAGSGAVIEDARVVLHRLGGATVHKAGIAAAAGLVALERMVDRLADDHARARELRRRLALLAGVRVEPEPVETNILFVDASAAGWRAPALLDRLAALGVLGYLRDERRIRFVTHRLIGDAEISRVVEAVAEIVANYVATEAT